MSEWARGADFDQYASHYDDTINQALTVTGCTRGYFARGRIDWLARCLHKLGSQPSRAMDFGCGTGLSAEPLFNRIGVQSYVGVDTSSASIGVALSSHRDSRTEFHLLRDYVPIGDVDLAYCNGVFHHIKVEERLAALEYISDSLRPGGLFALWENNPLNPGTRYVMSRIPFDQDAVTLRAGQASQLAQRAGFQVLTVSYLFIFPRILAFLRCLEPWFSGWPLGGQYQILCRKPGEFETPLLADAGTSFPGGGSRQMTPGDSVAP